MTKNKIVIVNLDESVQSKVRTSDDNWLSAKGNSDILVQTKNGVRHISNVFYAPGLKYNLLSLRQLPLKGQHVYFKKYLCEIKDKNNALIVRMTPNKMFPLKFSNQLNFCFNIIKSDYWLRHLHFRHLSFKTLALMGKKNIVKGIPNINLQDQVCERSALEKHYRNSFPIRKT